MMLVRTLRLNHQTLTLSEALLFLECLNMGEVGTVEQVPQRIL